MVGQLNFLAFSDGNATTFHTAEAIYPGFVKVNASKRIRNTIAGEEPDAYVTDTYSSGAENVTAFKKSAGANMYFDAAGTAGQKVSAGNRGMARGVNGYTSGQTYGVITKTAVSGLLGEVWIEL